MKADRTFLCFLYFVNSIVYYAYHAIYSTNLVLFFNGCEHIFMHILVYCNFCLFTICMHFHGKLYWANVSLGSWSSLTLWYEVPAGGGCVDGVGLFQFLGCLWSMCLPAYLQAQPGCSWFSCTHWKAKCGLLWSMWSRPQSEESLGLLTQGLYSQGDRIVTHLCFQGPILSGHFLASPKHGRMIMIMWGTFCQAACGWVICL